MTSTSQPIYLKQAAGQDPVSVETRNSDNFLDQGIAPYRLESNVGSSDHLVQFYETDEFLLETVSSYIGSGLGAGNSCVIIATPAHREGFELRLKDNGLDLSFAQKRGAYFVEDAGDTLSQFMVDGMPDTERFNQVIGGLITRAARGGQQVRIFGEMVALLWKEGKKEAAICLEQLWNHLRTTVPPFELLCAYSMHDFSGEEDGVPFAEICQEHGTLIPAESYVLLPSSEERLRAVALLQQKAASLAAEITERKEAGERLRISENRYRRLFEASQDGILLVDPQTCTISDANPSLIELLGYSREQLLGQKLWLIALVGDQQATLSFVQELHEQRMLRREKLPLYTRDGDLRYVELVSTIFRANGHEVIQCNIRDITERKLAEEARLYLASIVDSSVDAILSKDLDGTITSWNTAAERMYGYRAQEVVGRSVSLLFPPDRPDEFTQIMERIRRGECVESYETIRVRKDGSLLNVSVTVSPIKKSNGTIIGASAIARDITALKNLEQEREAFIGLVTHELKTPLTALQGNVQLANRQLTRLLSQQEQLGAAQQHTIEEVLIMLGRSQQQLRVQNRLINDLLDVSRIEEGKLELALAPCDLVGLVYETVQDYQAAYPSRLITLLLPDQDFLPVHADGDRLRQVLSNYLTNALKFSHESEPVQVRVLLQNGFVRVEVTDHGPGLSPEKQQHIWKRFYQAPHIPVQNGAKIGLGLGLYICQQLMNRQQGQVGVESMKGEGSTFWFELPLLDSLSSLPEKA
ncbi:MAG TPA: PAS domain S-box protein [Ktedonobacteraceae bacterium]|nr:PAS domain S-box protein [Ktedonobacteraceae bacterium]